MASLQRLKLILSPSIVSAPVALTISGFIWLSAGWSYITDTQLFYDQLFGPYGAVTLLQIQPNNLGELQNTVLNGSGTYYVVLFATGLIAGLFIFFLLESISRVVSGVSLFWRQSHSNRQTARQAVRESLARLGLRVLSLICWAIYTIVFTSILVPFSILVLQDALEGNGDWQKWLLAVIAFFSLAASIHLHVSFARMVFLRVRLFGGYDAELTRLNNLE
jgi:hypothetical protein